MAESPRIPLLYFAPVDGAIEHAMSRDHFLESLFYNLLLEPNGLLVTDVFFFNCKFLIELAEAERTSLFTRALEESLVVPAFRSESTRDFVTSLRHDIKESNIRGVEDGQYSTSPLDLARWLDRCYGRSAHRRRLVWPPDMGAAFGALMTDVLTQNDLGTGEDDRLQSLWQSVREFREAAVEDARLSTRLAGGTGVRRGELYNSFGRRMGLLDPGESVEKPRHLLDRAIARSSTGIEGLRLLVDTVNLAYQRSQATQYNRDSTYSVTQNIPGVLVQNAGSVLPELRRRLPPEEEVRATFTMNLKMPSVKTLLHADSGNLIAIRRSDTAEDYFAKRRAWSGNPTERAQEELTNSLRSYVAELVRFAAGAQEDRAVTFVQRTINETINLGLGALTAYGLTKVGASPEVSLISGIGAGATAVVAKLAGDRPRVPKSQFTVKLSAGPEVILPAGGP